MIRPTPNLLALESLGDHFSALAAQLRQPGVGWTAPPRQIGITSCLKQEGVSTVAAHLAMAAAQLSDDPILLVDAHLGDPSVHRTFGVEAGPGLAEHLVGAATIDQLVQETAISNLKVVTAGDADAAGLGMADPAAFGELLARLGESFTLVIVDLPPAEARGAGLSLASGLEGLLFVVEAERVHTHVARRVKQQLEQAGGRLLGIVFNKRVQHIPAWLYRNW
jgi:capsular exopolysaccharide synthesis family protein